MVALLTQYPAVISIPFMPGDKTREMVVLFRDNKGKWHEVKAEITELNNGQCLTLILVVENVIRLIWN